MIILGLLDAIKGLFGKKQEDELDEDKIVQEETVQEETVEPVDDETVVENEEPTVESLAKEQEVIDKLYLEQGGGEPSDEVLAMQVALNTKRHKYNISDKKNLNKDGWSQ